MSAEHRTLNLALQGGGAHGAFTWGVLDRLLEDDRLTIEAVSATSAGAMNGAMLVAGLCGGGREAARDLLARFWEAVATRASGPETPFADLFAPTPDAAAALIEMSPGATGADLFTRMFSPYQFNPLNFNPLRDVLEDLLDFDAIRSDAPPRLFVNATNVRTGRIKVFSGREMTVDALLASACLPFLFQTVEIGGEGYWDGGYMGNPALFPLMKDGACRDIVIVHVNPVARPGIPRTARDILNRVNEISFNSSLLRELRAIRSGAEESGEQVRLHAIQDEATMQGLGAATKLHPHRRILDHLFDAGRRAADGWLGAHRDDLNRRGSLRLDEMFG